MRVLGNGLLAWLAGWGLGVWLGFYDCDGLILYDFGAGVRAGAVFACAFAIAALWAGLFQGNR